MLRVKCNNCIIKLEICYGTEYIFISVSDQKKRWKSAKNYVWLTNYAMVYELLGRNIRKIWFGVWLDWSAYSSCASYQPNLQWMLQTCRVKASTSASTSYQNGGMDQRAKKPSVRKRHFYMFSKQWSISLVSRTSTKNIFCLSKLSLLTKLEAFKPVIWDRCLTISIADKQFH